MTAALAGGVLVGVPAAACSCASGLMEVAPADGATGVATDAAPVLVYSAFVEPHGTVLRDAATGAEVPAEIDDTMEGNSLVRRIVPLGELEPGATYEIEGSDDYGTVPLPVRFTTGDGPDATAPGPLVLVDVEGAFVPGTQAVPFGAVTNTCGDSLWLRPDFEAEPSDPHARYEFEVSWDDDPAEVARVTDADREDPMIGWGICAANVPALEAGDRIRVRARAVDLSGNEGPWSEPVLVRSIPTDHCGCSSAGEARGGAVASSWLAALALGRRRRPRPLP
ncbi:Ig-like domain-containing protein [Myxococcota bacterium]|nr:Ig-like domain-containing protein [Myxococcota bacterium]